MYGNIFMHYRVAKTHHMTELCRSFSAKEPYKYWLICEKRHEAFYGASPPVSMYENVYKNMFINMDTCV